MSVLPSGLSQFVDKNRAASALFVVVAVGFLCLALQPVAPWLFKWPAALQIPAAEWIGTGLGFILEAFKPIARGFSALMSYPMAGANFLFVSTPWPITIGVVTAVGWYIGGWRMAALGLFGLLFVLASGYWVEGMNTLALVAVSVPLALLAGLAIGMLAYEYPRFKSPVQAVLDVMQTVPLLDSGSDRGVWKQFPGMLALPDRQGNLLLHLHAHTML